MAGMDKRYAAMSLLAVLIAVSLGANMPFAASTGLNTQSNALVPNALAYPSQQQLHSSATFSRTQGISCPPGSTYTNCFEDVSMTANPSVLPALEIPVGSTAYLYTQIIPSVACFGSTSFFIWPITCPSDAPTPYSDLTGYWTLGMPDGNVPMQSGPTVNLIDPTGGYDANVLILEFTAVTANVVSISTGSNSINMVTNIIEAKPGDSVYGTWDLTGSFSDPQGDSGTISGPQSAPETINVYATLPVSVCSPYSNTYTNGNIATIWNNEEPIALIAVLIAFTIAALIFVLGSAAKSDRVRNFGIGELYEAAASAILVGLFVALATTVVGGVPYHLLPVIGATPSTNVICDSLNGITGLISGSPNPPAAGVPLQQIYSTIVGTYETGVYLTTTKLSITVTKVNVQYPPSLLSAVVYLTSIAPALPLAQLVVDAMYLLWTEYNLMVLFTLIGPAFVAAGVIFRSMFFTRAFGGMLMALGIAFFLVMPTLFSFAFATYTSIPPPNFQYIYAFSYYNVINELQDIWLITLYYPILIIAITYAFVTQVANFIGASASTGRLRAGLI